jgi:cytochrome c-type biogenesis protein CcmH/NrfG
MQSHGQDSDEQQEVQKVLRAATAHQKAEVLARRGNAAEALVQAELAVANDPGQAEYLALYADLLSQQPGRPPSSHAEVVRMVNDARKQQPDNPKVRLYRARVLKRTEDVEGAYREYKSVLVQDPNNMEAAREVRLHDMRRGKRTSDPKKSAATKKTSPGGQPAEEKTGMLNQDVGAMFGKLFKR